MRSAQPHAIDRRINRNRRLWRLDNQTQQPQWAALPASWSPGLQTLAGAAALYLAAVLIVSFPLVRHLATKFPGSSVDPLQHLWVMRWYRHCLLSLQAPWVCPDIQFPIGAHIGSFSPLLLQSLLFLPLSLVIANDVLCYNLVWIAAFLFTGLSTLILAWNVVAHRPAAVLAGLAAMLSTPVMMRSLCHLELMCVGAVPLFLAGWLRWLERPSRPGLVACVALYGLVTASAAYFAIYTVFPAAWLVLYEVARRGRAGGLAWLRQRLTALIGFVLLSLVVQGCLFTPQLLMQRDRPPQVRPVAQFQMPAMPPWGLVMPSRFHAISTLFPVDGYEATGYPTFSGCSYVGVVVLLLLHHTAVRRVRFLRAGYWWSALALMTLLAMGATWRVGQVTIPMPAAWLRAVFPPLRQTRDPGRFALIAVCLAAVVAAAGARSILSRSPRRWQRTALAALAAALIVLDLRIPYLVSTAPLPMPPAYRLLREQNPRARILEAPVEYAGADSLLSATAAYWQLSHGLRTSAGYSGFGNALFDDRLMHDSPFGVHDLSRPETYADPDHARLGVLRDVPAGALMWLYLNHHGFDYVVWHRWPHRPNAGELDAGAVPRLLARAMIHEDALTRVYETARLEPPAQPVLMHTIGWRAHYDSAEPRAAVERHAELVVYSPGADQALVVALEARGYYGGRTVTLRQGDRELARWRIEPGEPRTYRSPPIVLEPGVHTLTLDADGDHRPDDEQQYIPNDNPAPYSFLASSLRLEAPARPAALARTPPPAAGP